MTALKYISVTVNGQLSQCTCAHRMLAVDLIRDDLGLSGTHIGCEHGVCGACTILLDEAPVRSCLLLAAQLDGQSITTVEGLADPLSGELSVLQKAFRRHHALQCGFCTPGVLMSFSAFLRDHHQPTRDEVRDVLSGHLCRCTGYQGIVEAVMDAAGELHRAHKEDR